MDTSSENMDFCFKDWRYLSRLSPSRFRVSTIGFTRKTPQDWVRRRFNSTNFSFLLDGGGEFWVDGTLIPIEAPCVLVERPGAFLEYGPTSTYGLWREVYLMYEQTEVEVFQQAGVVDPGKWVRPLANPETATSRISEMYTLCHTPAVAGLADRMDALSELLLFEQLVSDFGVTRSREQEALATLRDEVFRHSEYPWDFASEARKHGMSESTFRRVWSEVESQPPGRFLNQCRLDNASRELVHTPQPVGAIAHKYGFSDPLYFSRQFKAHTGLSPRSYRNRYKFHD